MPKTVKPQIKYITKLLEEYIQEQSGGVKLTQAVADLTATFFCKDCCGPLTHPPTATEIEEAVANSKKLKLLEYSWHMSKDKRRWKAFIYTP
jgi:hypothetical protein